MKTLRLRSWLRGSPFLFFAASTAFAAPADVIDYKKLSDLGDYRFALPEKTLHLYTYTDDVKLQGLNVSVMWGFFQDGKALGPTVGTSIVPGRPACLVTVIQSSPKERPGNWFVPSLMPGTSLKSFRKPFIREAVRKNLDPIDFAANAKRLTQSPNTLMMSTRHGDIDIDVYYSCGVGNTDPDLRDYVVQTDKATLETLRQAMGLTNTRTELRVTPEYRRESGSPKAALEMNNSTGAVAR